MLKILLLKIFLKKIKIFKVKTISLVVYLNKKLYI